MNIRTPSNDVASDAALLLFNFFPAHVPYALLPPDFETSETTAHKSAKKIII